MKLEQLLKTVYPDEVLYIVDNFDNGIFYSRAENINDYLDIDKYQVLVVTISNGELHIVVCKY